MRFASVVLIALCTAILAAAPQAALADNTASAAVMNPGPVVWDTTIELRRIPDTLTEVPQWQEVAQVPVLKNQIMPTYPTVARQNGLEAEVWVQALVGSDGLVYRAHVSKKSVHPWAIGFEEAALVAAINCSYQPALANDKPLAAWITYPVRYKLE